jgi:hypothetical protein
MKTHITSIFIAVTLSCAHGSQLTPQLIGVLHNSEVPQKVDFANSRHIDLFNLPKISLANGQTKTLDIPGSKEGKIQLKITKRNSSLQGQVYIATPTHDGKLSEINKTFESADTKSTILLGSYPSTSRIPVKFLGITLWHTQKTQVRDAYLRFTSEG